MEGTLPMSAGPCTEHGLLLERIENLTKALDANTYTSNRLLEKLDRVASENDRAAVEMDHLKQAVVELKAELKEQEIEFKAAIKALETDMKAGDNNQWDAINKLKVIAYGALGLAVAIQALAPLLPSLWGK